MARHDSGVKALLPWLCCRDLVVIPLGYGDVALLMSLAGGAHARAGCLVQHNLWRGDLADAKLSDCACWFPCLRLDGRAFASWVFSHFVWFGMGCDAMLTTHVFMNW